MNIKTTVIVGIICLAVGAAVSWFVTNGIWDADLKTQLAEKDKLLADIETAAKDAKTSLDSLAGINKKMNETIDLAMTDIDKASKTTASLRDKVIALLKIVDVLHKNYLELSNQAAPLLEKVDAGK